jgi:hypothetical protein
MKITPAFLFGRMFIVYRLLFIDYGMAVVIPVRNFRDLSGGDQ